MPGGTERRTLPNGLIGAWWGFGRRFQAFQTRRTLMVYDRGVVLAYSPRSLPFRRIIATGTAGYDGSVLTLRDTPDAQAQLEAHREVDRSDAHRAMELARTKTPEEMLELNRRNRFIPVEQIESAEITLGRGVYVHVVVRAREGDGLDVWTRRSGKSRLNIVDALKAVLGDRLQARSEDPSNPLGHTSTLP